MRRRARPRPAPGACAERRLTAPPIVLASASPRRRELLAALGVAFTVDAAEIDERSAERDPVRLAEGLALCKARAVAARHPQAVVVGSDTVVALDGRLLGKPVDAAEARAMLRALRGRAHAVVTGVVVIYGAQETAAHARTAVTMRDYGDDEVEAFIASGSPFDKAGGYASQDPVFAPTARLDGCACAVVGLPLWTLLRLLRSLDVAASPPSLARCATCPERDAEADAR
ncbi:MAG: septum formation protein Maf [Dehalococcoidia bacterium]|nr:septum formation protein Maf [Dehalococcoidia bacterium]